MGRASRVASDREQQVRRQDLRCVHRLGDPVGAFHGALERADRLRIDDSNRAQEIALLHTEPRQQVAHRAPALQHHEKQICRRRAMPASLSLALRARDQSFDPPADRRHCRLVPRSELAVTALGHNFSAAFTGSHFENPTFPHLVTLSL